MPGETRYRAANEFGASDFLTLLTTPYQSPSSNRYVGLGYWQSSKDASGDQATNFHTFAYGFQTPLAAIPRTGFASWNTDIFGLLAQPEQKARTIQGSGRFDVDFAQSRFSTTGSLYESDVVGSGGQSTIMLEGGGSLTSLGTFKGILSYSGAAGEIEGSFYGPAAEEVGASFVLSNRYGTVLNGAMTGQRNSMTGLARNLSLEMVTTSEGLGNGHSGITVQTSSVRGLMLLPAEGGSQGGVTVTPTGPSTIHVGYLSVSGLLQDVSQPKANFTAYTGRAVAGEAVQAYFYRPGATNSELSLSYTSFVTWQHRTTETISSGQQIQSDTTHFVLFGIKPSTNAFAGMSGTAEYAGVAYGTGASSGGTRFDVTGTSRFSVDFGSARYSGSLRLSGLDLAGNGRDFGVFEFASTLNGNGFDSAQSIQAGGGDMTIRPAFFGPEVQEIGAMFSGNSGAVKIEGLALAKR